MPNAVDKPLPEMPDEQRRRILTALITTVALAVPAAKVLLGQPEYGGLAS